MAKKPRPKQVRVCLLSRHPVVLHEFQHLLSHFDFAVRAQRLDSADSTRLRRAPVYVLDAYGPRPETEVLIAGILDRFPKTRLLVLAEKFSESNAFPFLRLGAKGLLTYEQAREQLPRALQTVAAGGFWVPRTLLSRFVDSILSRLRTRPWVSGAAGLSRREREVLEALLGNLSNKEIAAKLNISERTAKFHVSNLLAKFSVQRRADLIMLCFQTQPPAS